MRLAIVVPVHDGAATLAECLGAIRAGMTDGDELVVVDDASRDASAAIAAAAGATVVRLAANAGPAAARNAGVRATGAEALCFVDADVVVAPDALARLRDTLATRPEIAAVFGSYDDRPRAGGIVSPYRNLLHHWVHQHGDAEAFTFWCGCGAVRRTAFEAVGGLDERRWRHSIEDIELGYRLRAAGHRIVLDRDLLATHLKRWTLRSMLRTDVRARALPWTRLLLESPHAGRGLNLSLAQRACVALVGLALAAGLGALAWPGLASVAVTAVAAVALLNRDFYVFLARRRGLAFALAAIPLHLLYFGCSGAGYAWGVAERLLGRRPPTPFVPTVGPTATAARAAAPPARA